MKDATKEIPQIDYDVRPLYRVSFPIAYKDQVIKVGSLHRLEKCSIEAIEKLTLRGTITEVRAPPLAVLPGWTRRAAKLEKAGIVDAVQFLGADVRQVGQYMRRRPATVEKWKSEVLTWLQAPENRG